MACATFLETEHYKLPGRSTKKSLQLSPVFHPVTTGGPKNSKAPSDVYGAFRCTPLSCFFSEPQTYPNFFFQTLNGSLILQERCWNVSVPTFRSLGTLLILLYAIWPAKSRGFKVVMSCRFSSYQETRFMSIAILSAARSLHLRPETLHYAQGDKA